MSTPPEPPRAPVPPQPPRPGSHVLAIVLLILALIILVSAVAVWTGLRFLSRTVQVHVEERGGEKKEVTIKTPAGSFEASKNVDEAGLGLPIYPGARPVKDKSASLNMNFGGEEGVRLVVGKFDTSDPIEKVQRFYEQRVGGQATKFTQTDSEGKTVFEIKHKDQEKVVALKSMWGGTRIELVHVVHGHGEVN